MNTRVLAQRKPKPASAAAMPSNVLQRKCACGGTPGLTREREECRKKREGGVLQRRARGPEPEEVPPIVYEVLRSSGQPLEAETRAFMEARFNHDFRHVRVHRDARAAESARAMNALAYTVGQNVVFAASQFAPRTLTGRQLLAHELAHVVQLGRAGAAIDLDRITPADHLSERQAADGSQSWTRSPLDVAPIGLALKRDEGMITFGEKEGSLITIKRGSTEAAVQREKDILDSRIDAENRGMIYINKHFDLMLDAVKGFKVSAQSQINALKGDPSGLYGVLPKLVDTLFDTMIVVVPGLGPAWKLGTIFAKALYTTGQTFAVTASKSESGDAKKRAVISMDEFATSMENTQAAILNDIQAPLKDELLTLSATNERIRDLLSSRESRSIDAVLDAIGVPNPVRQSPYGPVREALEVQFAEWLARQPFRTSRYLSPVERMEESGKEVRAVGKARVEARERARQAARVRHEPGS
jgi:hypothetical protein